MASVPVCPTKNLSRVANAHARSFSRVRGVLTAHELAVKASRPHPSEVAAIRSGDGSLQARGLTIEVARGDHAVGTLRLLRVHAEERVDIFLAMGYPENPSSVPALGFEIVCARRRPVVVFADLQDAGLRAEARSAAELVGRSLRRDAGLTHPPERLPEFAQAHSLGTALFCKRGLSDRAHSVVEAAWAYVDAWGGLLAAARCDEGEPNAALRAYKDHHRRHSSGSMMMRKAFGAGPVDRLEREFLYA